MRTYSVEEAASLLLIAEATVRRLAHAGLLRGAKPGRRWVFREEDLVAFLESSYGGSGQASVSGCKEKPLWQFIDEDRSGGSMCGPPRGSEYAALLGLKTARQRRNTTTT
ncbi:MAG: DNA-binding protein [Haliea sp.]|uniref:helix-turn-helix domain-containing protein n=1 Tax=Haliea TaxID=475794 RepID=UPI000A07082C|nr:DNA-binding protein [Haliea sp.]